MEFDINLWAVLVAGVAWFAIGAFWYSKAGFGKQWMAMMGFNEEEMKDSMTGSSGAKMMAISLVGALLMAYVLAHFVELGKVESFYQAFQLSFWIWLGFMAPIQLGSFLWEKKPIKLFALNTAYALVSLSVMAVILAFGR